MCREIEGETTSGLEKEAEARFPKGKFSELLFHNCYLLTF